MSYYISKSRQRDDMDKLTYILRNKNIKHTMFKDHIKIKENDSKEYVIYYENLQTPQYILSNEDDLNEIKKIYENINNKIDEYDTITDIILDIHEQTKNILQTKSEIKTHKVIIHEKKNINEFEKELENKKEKYINENSLNSKLNSGTFSLRSNIEMLGDQIFKLHQNSKFNVELDNFPQIKINLSEFTFIGSSGLIVTIEMDMGCLNLLSEPPKIKISSNKILKDNILKVISELKPFSDAKSWSVKYSISETIQNIFNMINTYGETEQEFSLEFDQIMNDVEYLVSIKNQNISETKLLELFDKELLTKTTSDSTESTTINTNNTYWKKGTGYGNDKTKKWNIDKYIKNINEKKNKISSLYDKFINILCLEYSDKNKLKNLDVNYLNRIIILLINYLENEEITKMNIMSICKFIDSNFEKMKSCCIEKIGILLKDIQTYMNDNDMDYDLPNLKSNETAKIIEKVCEKNIKKDSFIEMFESEAFKMYSGEFMGFHYNKKTINIDSEKLNRLKKEFNIMKKSISVNSEASMFFWIEKNKLEKMRFCITGPADTPYDQGIYIFDMTLSNDFPITPPLVNFSNNGGVRFNPNLYNCGKVCLSLLGTWKGDKGESWNSATSTFFHILVSIQSQILMNHHMKNK